jgi:putative ABC transport system permease protein
VDVDGTKAAAREVSMRDVLYACRMFRRAPLAALTIIATVALGLGLVTVAFTFLNAFIFGVDAVRNPRELFAVERPRTAGEERAPFTRSQYDALVRDTDVFSDTVAIRPDIDSRIEGRIITGTLVTGNFFHVLGVSAARGRALAPSDDQRASPNPVVVLSHRGWMRHFAGDPGVLTRTLVLNNIPFQIVGIMPEGFRGLTVSPADYWAPLSIVGQLRPSDAGREDAVSVGIVGRLKAGLSREQALAQLIAWDSRSVSDRDRSAARSLALEPRSGTVPIAEAMPLVTPLFFAFGLILMIGCANVANLLLARSVARQREIGIRLATGASRSRIIRQLLTESMLLAVVSAILAFAISRLVLDLTIQAVMTTLPPDVGDIRLAVPPADWRVVLFLVVGALISTMFFALVPALQATRLELVRAIRGEVLRDARPGRTRNLLIALQVTASALLLICSAVFLRSALAEATVDPGIRTSDTVLFGIGNERLRATALQAVRREPSVAAMAASWPDALSAGRAGVVTGSTGKSNVKYKFVSPEYFDVLGIDILRGRGFAPGERTASAAVAVVSETVASQLWPNREPLGQVLQLEPDQHGDATRADEPSLAARALVVVGIARDVPGLRLTEFKGAGVYVPISAEAAKTSLTVRVHGDPEVGRRALVERLTAIDPNIGEVLTLRLVARMATYLLQIAFWLTLALGSLALMLTLSGLFSVLSYLVEQRSKEIGVRIALGATQRNVCFFVLSQLVRPVGLGLLVGGALALGLGIVLVATPAADQIGTLVRVFDPIAYTVSLFCIVTASVAAALIPALRAGWIDPIATLRQD